MKQAEASSRNGVVGSKGKKIPRTPSMTAIEPIAVKTNFIDRYAAVLKVVPALFMHCLLNAQCRQPAFGAIPATCCRSFLSS